MGYTKLKKQKKFEVELENGNKTWVLELEYKNGDARVKVYIKDLIDNDDENIIKQATIKAKEYFKTLCVQCSKEPRSKDKNANKRCAKCLLLNQKMDKVIEEVKEKK